MKPKYNHKEAFCLMAYVCPACGHREVLWNSRDGVTPFMIPCSKCPSTEMAHVNFFLDAWAPSFKPQVGSRVFVDLTTERAKYHAERQLDYALERKPGFLEERKVSRQQWIDLIAADFYGSGDSPDIITIQETIEQQITESVNTNTSPWFTAGTFISMKTRQAVVWLIKGTCEVKGSEERHYLLSRRDAGEEVLVAIPFSEIDTPDYVCCGGILPSLLRPPVTVGDRRER